MTSFACYNDSIGDGDQMPPFGHCAVSVPSLQCALCS
nr:MAG TPA: hypothetical protein [Caudoviricetes sp.]DAY99964.1 MAG TPA: hypothetical protein [Caudoviricetes sp.]